MNIITGIILLTIIDFIGTQFGKIYQSDQNDLQNNTSKRKKHYTNTPYSNSNKYYYNENCMSKKDEVIEKYGRICTNCGSTENIDIHHKIPLSEGGTNCIENLIPLCRKCHEKIHRFSFDSAKSDLHVNDDYGYNISIDKKSLIGYKICNAIENQYCIKIKYKSKKSNKEEITQRTILPLEIKLGCECDNMLIQNSNYDKYKKFLRAFCYLRNEERLFRLDRILEIEE